MHPHIKLTLAALVVTMLFGLAVGTASANRLSVTEKNFEVIWNSAQGASKTDLSLIDNAEPPHTLTCKLTLLSSFTANTIVKSGKIGQITHATIGTCSAGTATLLQETLPWPINYVSFGGTLPNNITAITFNVIGFSFRIEEAGLSCLAMTSTTNPLRGIIESFSAGAPENIRVDETKTIPLTGSFGLCNFATPGRFKGTALVRNLPGTANITVTLI